MSSVGNLGNYQRLVQLAKAADGPVRLGLYVIAGSLFVGTAIGTAAGPAIKKVASRAVQAVTRRLKATSGAADPLFTVTTDADGGMGLSFRAGDQFRVLESDRDAILVDVMGNTGSPFVVSGKLLQSISDFTIENEI